MKRVKLLKNEGFRMEETQKARAEQVRERMLSQVGGQWTWSDTLRYLIEQGLRYDAATNGAMRPGGGTERQVRYARVVSNVGALGFEPTMERLDGSSDAIVRAADAGWPIVRVETDDMGPAYARGDLVSVEPRVFAQSRETVFAVYEDKVYLREIRCNEDMSKVVLMPRDTERAEPIAVTDFHAFRLLGVVRDVVEAADRAGAVRNIASR
jgi:SOS-response transcriptional repressor LexA